MKILRRYYEDRTEGKFIMPDDSHLYTLERPDLNNKPFVSCIPEGKYLVKRDKVGKHRWYKLINVPRRSGIEIHIANTVDELQGCIAPCLYIENGVGKGSRKACETLLEWIGDNGFYLEIRKYNPFKDGKWSE